MTYSLVVGVDAGATSTRVAVHTLDGVRVGYARGGAGNPSAHGLVKAVAAIGATLREALIGHDGSSVVASLAGVAGHVQSMAPELAKLWADLGIPAGPRLTGDVVIGYVAGSPSPDGSLLLSGTGAVAARIAGYEMASVADGLGWLLGDEGSGFWIGRAAAKAVVAALDRDRLATSGGSPSGPLTELVLEHFLGAERGFSPRDTADRLVRLAQADHMRLAALASLVSQAAAAGDPRALAIAGQAAGHLVDTVRRVHASGPVVLAGSVLTNEGPVRQAVLELLEGEPVATALDTAGAAAWLAARDLLHEGDRDALHARFTAPA
ncbi:N-acetylglucosamine kinase [Nonomuraea sp. LPB2021202275-12-8]|uniref:N-acetylglucosamine kinase n=1 Tax=Nonomuraea sp. LPB2021202275-12-8 TaxID=3120159 RepID=UPI00300DB1A0